MFSSHIMTLTSTLFFNWIAIVMSRSLVSTIYPYSSSYYLKFYIFKNKVSFRPVTCIKSVKTPRYYGIRRSRFTLYDSKDYLGSINNIIRKINGAQLSESIFSSPTPTPIPSNFDKVVQNIISSTTPSSTEPLPILVEPGGNFFSQLGYLASEISAQSITLPLFTAIVAGLVFAGVGYDDSKVGNPYDGLDAPRYDVERANLFYGSRPLYVFRRMMRLLFLTAAFNWNLLIDWRTGNLAKNEKIRAKEALELCTKLGPTFIKLGQALSIRTDLINEAYATELQKLQDAVPPFNSTYAKEIICKEIGIRNLNEKFKYVSDKPIAAASIGQVYRATLLDGTDVAIKVQRPKILDAIAVDLYLLRLISPLQVRATNLAQGIIADQFDIDGGLAFVDEWGRGIVVGCKLVEYSFS